MVSVLTLPAGLTCLKDVAAGICKACFNSYSEINECIVTFIGTSERVEKGISELTHQGCMKRRSDTEKTALLIK